MTKQVLLEQLERYKAHYLKQAKYQNDDRKRHFNGRANAIDDVIDFVTRKWEEEYPMKLSNKGPWKVTCQMLGDTMKYAVVRIIDVTKTEHNGNREYTDHGYMESREEAVAIAYQLNEAEKE